VNDNKLNELEQQLDRDPRLVAGGKLLRALIAAARKENQLPAGMEHCTIRFVSCPIGHGRLTATNWVDNGCQSCELARLKRGEFTPEEFQDILHASTETSRNQWERAISEYRGKLTGFTKPEPHEEERFRSHYQGQTEPCCECGEEYPRADLVIGGEIYCAKCRGKR
jgi:hypothetical protein